RTPTGARRQVRWSRLRRLRAGGRPFAAARCAFDPGVVDSLSSGGVRLRADDLAYPARNGDAKGRSAMLTPALVLGAIFVSVAVWSTIDRRRRLLARVRDEWGRPRSDTADIEGIADFFRSHDAGPDVLDDRTWADLMLDDVFTELDRTQSSVGQQLLYCRLRRAPTAPNLPAFEALVDKFSSDDSLRERMQVVLARVRNPSG